VWLVGEKETLFGKMPIEGKGQSGTGLTHHGKTGAIHEAQFSPAGRQQSRHA